MTVVPSEKSRLRQQLRRARGERDERRWRQDSQRLCQRLLTLPAVQGCHSIALFWPLTRRREPDLRPLDQKLRSAAKNLYYPCMHGPGGSVQWGFRLTNESSDLVPVGGLYEPGSECCMALPGQLQVIITPCLAIDDRGYRLGYGAGFYDRVLSEFAPPAFVIGVCFSSERFERLPNEAHDKPVDWIVTESDSRAALNELVIPSQGT